ncbi:MAG: zinc metalloprotease [Flavobacteriaceae bacterium]|nr:zinc metalloprotease [Flavobacteriaceae bacterium]
MKKVFLSMAAFAMIFASCSENESEKPQDQSAVNMDDFYLYTEPLDDSGRSVDSKSCYSMNNLNSMLDKSPGLYQKMYDIELHSRRFINGKKPDGAGNGNGNGGGGGDTGGGGDPIDDGLGSLTIPVYVYVVYANSTQNISDAQVNSQIDVLNADFNDTNYGNVLYADRGADVNISFTLNPGDIDRRSNPTASWGTNNAVKSAYPAVPGYLTMWVANIGGGVLGYAQFPGGNASTDGIVVSPQYFGDTGTATAPFDGGRTTTHEVGHWMNLRHIWGDGRCNRDDFVADTPSSDRPNYSCNTPNPVHCRTPDMTENYMDYTDDVCMELFTVGQKDRMRAVFAPGGPRASIVGN